MKQDGSLNGRDLHPREARIAADYDVRVHCDAGEIDAAVVNFSSAGFRLKSRDPLKAGWKVTLEAANHDTVKAVICWASGFEAGGVFAEPVAL